jgi:hypothetical protein
LAEKSGSAKMPPALWLQIDITGTERFIEKRKCVKRKKTDHATRITPPNPTGQN